MNRSSIVMAWLGTTILAFMLGWFVGVKNATRVAAGVTSFTTYMIFFAVVCLIVAGIWSVLRIRHTDHHPLVR